MRARYLFIKLKVESIAVRCSLSSPARIATMITRLAEKGFFYRIPSNGRDLRGRRGAISSNVDKSRPKRRAITCFGAFLSPKLEVQRRRESSSDNVARIGRKIDPIFLPSLFLPAMTRHLARTLILRFFFINPLSSHAASFLSRRITNRLRISGTSEDFGKLKALSRVFAYAQGHSRARTPVRLFLLNRSPPKRETFFTGHRN